MCVVVPRIELGPLYIVLSSSFTILSHFADPAVFICSTIEKWISYYSSFTFVNYEYITNLVSSVCILAFFNLGILQYLIVNT